MPFECRKTMLYGPGEPIRLLAGDEVPGPCKKHMLQGSRPWIVEVAEFSGRSWVSQVQARHAAELAENERRAGEGLEPLPLSPTGDVDLVPDTIHPSKLSDALPLVPVPRYEPIDPYTYGDKSQVAEPQAKAEPLPETPKPAAPALQAKRKRGRPKKHRG